MILRPCPIVWPAAQSQHPRIPFHSVHVLSTDSHGNLYTGDLGAAPRVQKFVPVSGVPAR